MSFMDSRFYMQVFIVVRTHASNARVSWTLAFICKYFLSSVHMLLMHVFHGHMLLYASIFSYMDDDILHLNIFWEKRIGIMAFESFFYFVNVLNGSDYRRNFEQLVKKKYK